MGLWRSKPRIGFLMSRKWLPWMVVLVTGISHLWDALRASFPGEDLGRERNRAAAPLRVVLHAVPTRFPKRQSASPIPFPPTIIDIIGQNESRRERRGEARRKMKNEMIHDNSTFKYRPISSIVAQRWEKRSRSLILYLNFQSPSLRGIDCIISHRAICRYPLFEIRDPALN